MKKITATTTKHYLLSVQNIDSLKRTPIETFSEIIITDSVSYYRPFLYDFLAHRAVAFFINEEPNITKPVYAFVIDSANYFKFL